MQRQGKNCRVIDPATLEVVPFNWFSDGHVEQQETRKTPYTYQSSAVAKAKKHFADHERGKLIMACGTGKTYTSLQIVEEITAKHANVLFLAPSISLVSQTLREYAYECQDKQRYVIICSDSKADRDSDGYTIADLPISPTTDASKIAKVLKVRSTLRTIVFCTYQSLERIKQAQERGAPKFDLVVCDEAHRTAGIEGTNYFTLINDRGYVKATKRLYMTATPKIYGESAKNKATEASVALASMDVEEIYGKEFYQLDFSAAITQKLLSDYKVIILTISESYASENLQEGLVGTDLALEDAAKLVGCYKALRDQGEPNTGIRLGSAVGFVNSIETSKAVTAGFESVVQSLDAQENDGFTCKTEHIDGTDSTIDRHRKLEWLKEDAGYTDNNEKICRILMNSKCLTEGIDVPSLDAILFLQPRKSQVDVVQAVGRVMRKKEGKDYGYVILPVVIPEGTDPVAALNDNKTYKVVWKVLNALRSHDDNFGATIENLNLNENKPDKIKVIGVGLNCEEEKPSAVDVRAGLQQNLTDIREKIYAKIVEECGDRLYDEKWTSRIAEITKTVSTRISGLLKTNHVIKQKFNQYLQGLRAVINNNIKDEQAMQMLAEHLVTKPAFDSLFKDYKFSQHNPVSKSMEAVLASLDNYGFSNELKDCEKFYDSVAKRLEEIDNSAARQKIVTDMYENFINATSPKLAKSLGVTYTPVEVVDFILHSVEKILQQDFSTGLTDRGVHVIDPFVGTGTFIARLFQSKQLIKDRDLVYKFNHEIHANEFLLLPYYIGALNIESAYYDRKKQAGLGDNYEAFKGIVLTDTFQIGEHPELISDFLTENKQQLEKQRKAPIKVIVGNSPWSTGQRSENDANKNLKYKVLDQKIKSTYVMQSTAKLNKHLYDSYIRAIRWASDRIGDSGVVAFLTNGSVVKAKSMDGLRSSLAKEFSSVYIFDLKGDLRGGGKEAGESIFSIQTPVAITLLVKNPAKSSCTIKYFDIGNFLSREKKSGRINKFGNITQIKTWETIIPNKQHEWIKQRDTEFEKFIPIESRKEISGIFAICSNGVKTNRDIWVYNYDRQVLQNNVQKTITFYNNELKRWQAKDQDVKVGSFVSNDDQKISWSDRVKKDLKREKTYEYDKNCIRQSLYRPFSKRYLYYSKTLVDRQGKTPKIFPLGGETNLAICVSMGMDNYLPLMSNMLPDLALFKHLNDSSNKIFPRYSYDNGEKLTISTHILSENTESIIAIQK